VETSLQDPLQQLSGEKACFVMISTSVIVFSTCSGCCVSVLGLEELDSEGDPSIVREDDEDVDRNRHERVLGDRRPQAEAFSPIVLSGVLFMFGRITRLAT
jgi:hypothetical protein